MHIYRHSWPLICSGDKAQIGSFVFANSNISFSFLPSLFFALFFFLRLYSKDVIVLNTSATSKVANRRG